MERDYEKADGLLSQVVRKGMVRFSSADSDLEERLIEGKSRWASSRSKKKLRGVNKTIETIAKDAELISEAMELSGKKPEVVCVNLSRDRREYLHFYVNYTSEKHEYNQIVTDRDLLTGEWKITQYTVPSSRCDEFFECLAKGDVTFHSRYIGRIKTRPRAQKVGEVIGALLFLPLAYLAGEFLGDYDVQNIALLSMIPVAGAVIGRFGGRRFLHNKAREFLQDKEEGHPGFGYLRTFCALSADEGEIVPNAP